jgi:hypothetical protein
MRDDNTLHEKARRAIQAGTLPARWPESTWGGPGVGVECAICGEVVKHDEVELETEFAGDGDNPDVDKRHFHVHCFAVWKSERQSFEHAGEETCSSDQARPVPPASMAGERPK